MTIVSESLASAMHHHKAGQLAEAEALCRSILAGQPKDASALHLLGLIAHETGQHKIAIALIERAIAIHNTDPAFHNNLGKIYRALWRLDEAAESSRHALALDPTFADAHYNLGSVLYRQGDLPAAMECLRRAIALEPDHARAHDRLGSAYLLLGDFASGWPEYEWRWRNEDSAARWRSFVQPQWRGEPLEGAHILLHSEQGFGDTLQFVRYAPMVAARGGRVVLEVQPELHRLLCNVTGAEKVVARGDALPDFSWHTPLLSLPLAFRTELATIPAEVPYLGVDPVEAQTWAARISGSALRVGLVWAGNPRQKWDQIRSLRKLSILAPLAGIDEITFVSLQKGAAAPQISSSPAGMHLVDLSANLKTFSDTAAAIVGLDLVITTDTAIAHLAGALGKPVWILLAYVADWIWLIGREDSPWYPTARLFRQHGPGDWSSVIEHVAGELRRLAAGDRSVLCPKLAPTQARDVSAPG